MPRDLVRSVGPLKEFLWVFSRFQTSDSSSLLFRSRRLAAAFDFLARRRQKNIKAKNAANARAPRVQPRTIGSVLEPPPLPVLAVVVDDAPAALAAEDAAIEVVGIDAADALKADVEEELEELDVEELVDVEEEVLDVEAVEVGWFPRAEVTTVYTD